MTDPTEAPVESGLVAQLRRAAKSDTYLDGTWLAQAADLIEHQAARLRALEAEREVSAAPACDDDVAEQWRERVDAEVRPLFDVDEHGDWTFRDTGRLDPVGAVVDRALRVLAPEIAARDTKIADLSRHLAHVEAERAKDEATTARLTAERDEAQEEADILVDDNAEQTRMLDTIARKLGLADDAGLDEDDIEPYLTAISALSAAGLLGDGERGQADARQDSRGAPLPQGQGDGT